MRILTILCVIALVGTAGAGDDLPTLRAKAALVRQDAQFFRWCAVPWYTDAVEGVQTARAEKRPVFLWATGDNPLGRC